MFSKAVTEFFNTITTPVAAFEKILAEKLPVWVPLVLIIFTAVVTTHFTYDVSLDRQIELMEYNEDIPEDQADMAIQQMDKLKEPPLRYIFYVLPVITVPVMYALMAVFFLLVGNFVLGGKATFADVFNVTIYAGAISIFQFIIQIAYVLITGTGPLLTSPAAFLPLEDAFTVMYKVLSALDIFVIWYLVIVGLGLKVLYKFTTGKAMLIPFGLYAIYVIIFKVLL